MSDRGSALHELRQPTSSSLENEANKLGTPALGEPTSAKLHLQSNTATGLQGENPQHAEYGKNQYLYEAPRVTMC